jgi:hypothetical protein
MVQLIRDPRDVAVSYQSYDGGGWHYSARDHVATWKRSVELSQQHARRYEGRYLAVRYEDLVRQPEETVRRVCEIVDLDFHPCMLEASGHLGWKGANSFFNDIGRDSKAISTMGIGRYRTHLRPDLIFLYQTKLRTELVKCGYDLEESSPWQRVAIGMKWYSRDAREYLVNKARASRSRLRGLLRGTPLYAPASSLYRHVFRRSSERTARRSKALRRLLDEGAWRSVLLDPGLYEGRSWEELDRVYTICRRQLRAMPDWRQSPARVHEVAREAFDAVSPHISLEDKVYCDLGCGGYHPYGVSTILYLNGARSTIALDLGDCDKRRAAEALSDLLLDCLSAPDRWHWPGIDRESFLQRAHQFGLKALGEGNLEEGLAGLPLKHIVTDIHNPILEEDSIDVMASRAVLEHFLDFGVAVGRMYALMRRGGVAYHHIDLVDHRAYTNSHYHWWSFLAEGEDWSDGLVNRLRSCEIRPHFERAGFESCGTRTGSPRCRPGSWIKSRAAFGRCPRRS